MTTYHPDVQENTKNGSDKQSVSDKAREHLETGKEKAQEVAQSVRTQAADTAGRAADTAGRASDQGAQFVRDNPALALAGAAAFGVLLGMALRGRD